MPWTRLAAAVATATSTVARTVRVAAGRLSVLVVLLLLARGTLVLYLGTIGRGDRSAALTLIAWLRGG